MGELGYILKKQVIFLAQISNEKGLALSFSKTANDAKITRKPTLLIMKAASTSHERRLKCIFFVAYGSIREIRQFSSFNVVIATSLSSVHANKVFCTIFTSIFRCYIAKFRTKLKLALIAGDI